MRFSKKRLVWLCHSMATMLDAGLPVSRVLQVLQRQASGRMKPAIGRVGNRIERGETLAESMRRESGFPALLVDMVEVGETSGALERTLGEVGRYYEFQRRLWRSFLARITWPVAQYVLAVAVVAVTFSVLAGLGQGMGHPGVVLALGYGIPAALILGYVLFSHLLGHLRAVHELLIRLPLVRSASLSLALARFSLLMHLASEAGLSLLQALPRALRGTGNEAFAARSDRMIETVKQGGTLTEALEAASIFPEDYTAMVQVAEESGKLAERFDWLAREQAERADTALRGLSRAVSAFVWILAAAVIIAFIFMIFGRHISGLKDAMP